MTLKQVIEALVFASPKPMLTKEIVAALKAAGRDTDDQTALDYAKMKEPEVAGALAELQADYIATGRAFHIVEQVNGWTFVSEAASARWIRQLYPEAKPTRLSGPQLETLAIIAYRQPVTRADIEAVRGVAVDGVMQILLDRALVKIAGRAEVPGRPLLYETTEYFLQHFGLKTTSELPNADELKRIQLPTATPPPEEVPVPAEQASQPAEQTPEVEAPEAGTPGEETSTEETPEAVAEESVPEEAHLEDASEEESENKDDAKPEDEEKSDT